MFAKDARLDRELVASDKAANAQREIDRATDQVFGPAVSSDTQFVSGTSLGVFGTPMEPGEFMSAAGGDEPGEQPRHEARLMFTGKNTTSL